MKIFLAILVCALAASVHSQTRHSNVKQHLSASPARSFRTATTSSPMLPIRRVVLYSNGVAYIERRGMVTGDAEIELSFKQSQVDDVLKSMVVLDLGQGKIGAVSYNSSAPVSSRISEIPFSVEPVSVDGGGISAVLAQLQGAQVAVASAKGNFVGSILTVEKRQIKTEKETKTTSVLVIASETGEITSFDLSEVRSVKLLDEGTKKDINEFANATASTRRLDAKTITVTSHGAGQREMVVSYTIAAPIWKTTYRVVLDQEGKPFFQGWAIVDNVSDENWQDVQLSLVSGSPISFIQQLQQPFYRYRPVVPMPRDLQLNPQNYEPQSGSGNGSVQTTVSAQSADVLPRGMNYNSQLRVGAGRDRDQFQVDGASGSENTYVMDGQEINGTKLSDALTGGNSGVVTAAKGEEIGDLFEYRIEQPVTVVRDRSALIPIVQTKMDGERVAVYNEAVRQDRPYSGVLLKNTTNLTLENGSITVIDGNAYAGEALMDRLKPKEQRLISFALDLGTSVRVRNTAEREPTKLIKAVNGVFQVHYFRGEQKTFLISNQTDRPKVLYLEYPIREGWELSEDSPKPDYSTQRYYRFRVELGPLAEKEIKISTRQPLMDTYQLNTLTKVDLELFVTRGYINEATRAQLERMIDIRSQLAAIESKLESFDDEVQKIESDQKRLRENIEALSKTPEARTLIARYITKAGEPETRVEQIEKERREIAGKKEELSRQLAAEIRSFEVK